MVASYVWVTLGVIAGIIGLYFTCLKLAKNDWIGNIPNGPRHLPGVGCLVNLLRVSEVESWLEEMFEMFGDVVKYCLCGTRVVIVKENKDLLDGLQKNTIMELTHFHIISLLRSLGLVLNKDIGDISDMKAKQLFQYKIPIDDFASLMDSSDKFREALNVKKTENLLTSLSNKPILLDQVDKKDLEECRLHVDHLAKSLVNSPQKLLPGLRYLPIYFFERKKLRKSLSKLQSILQGIWQKIIINSDNEGFGLFLALFIWMNLSRTTPKRRNKRRISITVDEIMKVTKDYQFSFDIVGLRFYRTSNYFKILDNDIPNNTMIVSYAKN